MKKIAIYGQQFDLDDIDCLEELLEVLQYQEVEVVIEREFRENIECLHLLSMEMGSFDSHQDLDPHTDMLISLGGDGTILRAITYVRNYNIPILGINTGRLGFLATVHKDLVREAFEELFEGEYVIEERALLEVEVADPKIDFKSLNFALNEITVSRKNTTSMITVSTFLNGEYLTSYWADGLIVATATGSTGYSLSCGGPVIMPRANSFILTPIAPHNLNARPLVIPDDTEIKLTVYGREEQHLISLDSRIATLQNETEIILRKCNFGVKMVQLASGGFFKTLRNKLLWGEDRRN
ncbi:MAG: NAD kinase [Flavobacteriaceae bacterium]|nr:NAD kinase [Flavobacteriaceae bacterium]